MSLLSSEIILKCRSLASPCAYQLAEYFLEANRASNNIDVGNSRCGTPGVLIYTFKWAIPVVFPITSDKKISQTRIIYLLYSVALLSDYMFRPLLN